MVSFDKRGTYEPARGTGVERGAEWWRDRITGRLAVLVIFIVQNTQDVRFHFLFLDFTWPLWLYTILVALFGALVWFGLGVMRRHRRRKERRDDR